MSMPFSIFSKAFSINYSDVREKESKYFITILNGLIGLVYHLLPAVVFLLWNTASTDEQQTVAILGECLGPQLAETVPYIHVVHCSQQLLLSLIQSVLANE